MWLATHSVFRYTFFAAADFTCSHLFYAPFCCKFNLLAPACCPLLFSASLPSTHYFSYLWNSPFKCIPQSFHIVTLHTLLPSFCCPLLHDISVAPLLFTVCPFSSFLTCYERQIQVKSLQEINHNKHPEYNDQLNLIDQKSDCASFRSLMDATYEHYVQKEARISILLVLSQPTTSFINWDHAIIGTRPQLMHCTSGPRPLIEPNVYTDSLSCIHGWELLYNLSGSDLREVKSGTAGCR